MRIAPSQAASPRYAAKQVMLLRARGRARVQEDREAAEAIASRLQAAMPGCVVQAEPWEGAPGS